MTFAIFVLSKQKNSTLEARQKCKLLEKIFLFSEKQANSNGR